MPTRKPKPLKPITRDDRRTGDEYLREWIVSVGNATRAEEIAELCRGHLRVWLYEPGRRFSVDVGEQVARAANCPLEVVLYRDTPIRDLDFWRFAG